jgi:signal transduction histidine kinase
MLLAVKMNLDKIKRDLTSDPDKLQTVRSLLSDTQELLNQTIDEIRTLTFELRPPMLEDFGLMPALRWILDSFEKWSGVKVSLKSKGKERRYSRDIEVALFRIAQEALTNISKHACAKEVKILVSNQDTEVSVSIRDNGVGFDAERLFPTSGSGMGLLNIKERVDMLGGKVEIISQPRKGTTININIPSSEVKDEEDQIAGR